MLDALLLAASEAESSKTPLYLAGGLVVAWAIVLSVIGLREPGFPGTTTIARGAITVGWVLVLATAAATIITA